MAGFSNAVEQAILNCYFNQTNITAPTNIYMSLHSADPGETGVNELTGNGYARTECTSSFPANSGGGSLANDVAITTAAATDSDWTEATHFGIWTASTSGTFIGGGQLSASKTVQVGDTATFAVGALTITLD